MTNFERIKNMSIQEMSKIFSFDGDIVCNNCIANSDFCSGFCNNMCPDGDCHNPTCKYRSCEYLIKLWLESEVENAKN